ncbi:MAG: hypothetical protein H0X49_13315 [Acidobacteria bacterium]|nr:hypothetical protein [Acidobacteriota bacterium]
MSKTENGATDGSDLPPRLLDEKETGLHEKQIRANLAGDNELMAAIAEVSELHLDISHLSGKVFSLYKELDEYMDKKLSGIYQVRQQLKTKVKQMSAAESKVREKLG